MHTLLQCNPPKSLPRFSLPPRPLLRSDDHDRGLLELLESLSTAMLAACGTLERGGGW